MLIQIVVPIIRRIPLTISGFNGGNQHMQCVYIKISARLCARLPAISQKCAISSTFGWARGAVTRHGVIQDDEARDDREAFICLRGLNVFAFLAEAVRRYRLTGPYPFLKALTGSTFTAR